ncbi:unnamed protein product [Durusdinium trenchii]
MAAFTWIFLMCQITIVWTTRTLSPPEPVLSDEVVPGFVLVDQIDNTRCPEGSRHINEKAESKDKRESECKKFEGAWFSEGFTWTSRDDEICSLHFNGKKKRICRYKEAAAICPEILKERQMKKYKTDEGFGPFVCMDVDTFKQVAAVNADTFCKRGSDNRVQCIDQDEAVRDATDHQYGCIFIEDPDGGREGRCEKFDADEDEEEDIGLDSFAPEPY